MRNRLSPFPGTVAASTPVPRRIHENERTPGGGLSRFKCSADPGQRYPSEYTLATSSASAITLYRTTFGLGGGVTVDARQMAD